MFVGNNLTQASSWNNPLVYLLEVSVPTDNYNILCLTNYEGLNTILQQVAISAQKCSAVIKRKKKTLS